MYRIKREFKNNTDREKIVVELKKQTMLQCANDI